MTKKVPLPARSAFAAVYSGECQKASAASFDGNLEITMLRPSVAPSITSTFVAGVRLT